MPILNNRHFHENNVYSIVRFVLITHLLKSTVVDRLPWESSSPALITTVLLAHTHGNITSQAVTALCYAAAVLSTICTTAKTHAHWLGKICFYPVLDKFTNVTSNTHTFLVRLRHRRTTSYEVHSMFYFNSRATDYLRRIISKNLKITLNVRITLRKTANIILHVLLQ